ATAYKWHQPTDVEFDQRLKAQPSQPYRVVAIDFGIKRAILERLASHGCELVVLPATSNLEQVLEQAPEGVFLSNGPGDPAAVHGGIELTRGLLEQHNLPIFGILNDCTVAAIELVHKPVFGVQYHPEASPGPHDADHHFAKFVALMAQRRSMDKIERP
ncbi:MAG: carbamoyl phosphate synthase small subunit, partial [Synechococcus sp. LacPavin_0920_WC12_MAG_50_7]|nr:carbamoyl phosphate synthase small subunit [Synechococcus sp. LacPavin_0920_WC12_MAG_50_7]